MDRQSVRQVGKQTHRQAPGHTDEQADRQRLMRATQTISQQHGNVDRQTDRQTDSDRQAGRQEDL